MKKIMAFLFITLFTLNVCGQQNIVGELIFPLQEQHVHGSSIVELPNGLENNSFNVR